MRQQLECARSDEERALAIGFASHLLVDVIAHNHFVPAHEHMWASRSMAAHAAAEWAMDTHIRRHLFFTPAELLDQHRHELTAYVARHFGCQVEAALLRASRLCRISATGPRGLWTSARHRFNHYLRETTGRMGDINRILAGEAPLWHAESPCMETTRARIGLCMPHQLRGRMPLPQDLFQMENDAPAMTAPIAAPASTSLG